jgi:hypothetical protein
MEYKQKMKRKALKAKAIIHQNLTITQKRLFPKRENKIKDNNTNLSFAGTNNFVSHFFSHHEPLLSSFFFWGGGGGGGVVVAHSPSVSLCSASRNQEKNNMQHYTLLAISRTPLLMHYKTNNAVVL